MLLVRRGDGFPGTGEAFSGAGEGFPGATAAGAASVVAELTRDAIEQFLACWAGLAHRSGCGAASSKGAAISKQHRLAETGTGSSETSAKTQQVLHNPERASGKILAIKQAPDFPGPDAVLTYHVDGIC